MIWRTRDGGRRDEKGNPLASQAVQVSNRSARKSLRGRSGLLLSVLLAGCVTDMPTDDSAFQPSNRPITVDNFGRNDRQTELARSQHPTILATYGGEYSDPKLERMVAKVVGSLTTVSGNPSQTYRITILNSPQINAFALPGGYLYITRGLLALANDSAELAAVLAHEMGHVTANHGIQRQQLEEQELIATKVVKEVLGGSPEAQNVLVRNKLKIAQFSRNQELQADAVGIKASGEAGFDAFAAARFLKTMADYSNLRSVSGASDASLDFLASHPNTPQRIDLALRHARQFGQPGTGQTNRDSYLAGIDGLLFGDTPDEGFVRGHTFLHPKLGIAFAVPDGFVIDNSATAVTAAGPNNLAVRFDGVALPPEVALTDYLRSGWVQGLEEASLRQTTVNGVEAATARATSEGWRFDVTVVRANGRVYRMLTAAPEGSTQLDDVARVVTSSFRLLSAAEKADLKPLRIKIVTVGRRDTIETMAARMIGVDRKLELFRVLNGLDAGAELTAGGYVKIVTDQ